MKPRKTDTDLKENALLDEVHRTEREIDTYLAQQVEEARAIVEEAQEKAGISQEQIALEAEKIFKEIYDKHIEKAQKEAESILEDGSYQAEDEEKWLEENKGSVLEKILELVLEKKQ